MEDFIIDYKGKKIVCLDMYKIAEPAKYPNYQQQIIDYILSQPLHSVLFLIDSTAYNAAKTGLKDPKTIMEKSHNQSKETKLHIKARATFGVTGIMKALFDMINPIFHIDIKIFQTKEEALDYLVSFE